MPLQALKIIEEEFFRTNRHYTGRHGIIPKLDLDALTTLEARIKDRIAKECIEQPDPDLNGLKNDCVHCEAGYCNTHVPDDHIPF